MADDAISEHVFLDTEVFVHFGFQYASTPFKALSDLIAKGRLKLVITDVVIREVEARIEKAVHDATGAHKRFSKEEGRVLRGVTLEGIAAKVQKFDEAAVVKNLKENFYKFLEDHNAVTIETKQVSLDEVMDDYFATKPPFGTGDKKSEFPDAFTVKALVDWGDSESAEILVVSGDNGVRDACGTIDYLHPSQTMEGMLDDVADDDDKLAEFIRAEIGKHDEEIKKKVIGEFEDRYFFVIDENGDAEVSVQKAKLDEVEILEVGEKEATVQVRYHLEYEADVSYDDPDMMSYDSETGQTFSWGTKEDTVYRQAYALADVQVSFEGLDPDWFEIDDVTVTEPSDSMGVELYDPRDDK
jgi:hypothetical protein